MDDYDDSSNVNGYFDLLDLSTPYPSYSCFSLVPLSSDDISEIFFAKEHGLLFDIPSSVRPLIRRRASFSTVADIRLHQLRFFSSQELLDRVDHQRAYGSNAFSDDDAPNAVLLEFYACSLHRVMDKLGYRRFDVENYYHAITTARTTRRQRKRKGKKKRSSNKSHTEVGRNGDHLAAVPPAAAAEQPSSTNLYSQKDDVRKNGSSGVGLLDDSGTSPFPNVDY